MVDPDRSRWIPFAFIGFFGVVLAANAAMIWLAFATWTGLKTESAYQKGLAYNDRLAEARAQAALGWQVDVAFAERAPGRLEIAVDLADRYGNPLERALVDATLLRPTHEGHDRTAVLKRTLGGHYEALVELPLAGQWDVDLRVESAGEVWRGTRRVVLRP